MLCLSCLLVLLPRIALAYEITPAELGKLESNLSRLETLNSESRKELQVLRQDLQASKEESRKLTIELQGLRADSTKQEELLKNANKSLDAYAKEQRKVKLQRTMAYGLSVLLALFVLA